MAANEIDLWLVLPICTVGFFLWGGIYVFATLSMMRHDPREIEYRKRAGKNLGILPDKLFQNKKNDKET